MDAAEPAGRKDADARQVRDDRGRRAGWSRRPAPRGDGRAHVPPGELADREAGLAHIGDLIAVHADDDLPVDDADGRGDDALFPDDPVHLEGGLDVLRVGHAVGDDGAFQRHHRPVFGKCRLDLRGNSQIGFFHVLMVLS